MRTTELDIRHATIADVDLLADLAMRTFRDAFADLNDPDDMRCYLAQAFDPEQVAAEIRVPGSVFLLGYHDGFSRQKPVGYSRLAVAPAPEDVSGAKPVQLFRVYVESNAVGSGYGSALIKASLDEAARRGYETVWLSAWERNKRALRFYERWGFRVVGTTEFVLGKDVQSDWVMERSLI